jgi:hypothetical protein
LICRVEFEFKQFIPPGSQLSSNLSFRIFLLISGRQPMRWYLWGKGSVQAGIYKVALAGGALRGRALIGEPFPFCLEFIEIETEMLNQEKKASHRFVAMQFSGVA